MVLPPHTIGEALHNRPAVTGVAVTGVAVASVSLPHRDR